MNNKFIVTNEETGTISLRLPLPAGKALLYQLLSTYLLTAKTPCPCGKPDCVVAAGDKLWAQLADEGAAFLADESSPQGKAALLLAMLKLAR